MAKTVRTRPRPKATALRTARKASAPPKASARTKSKAPVKRKFNATFTAFLNAHPAFYLGAFALRGPPLRKGVSFSRLVAAQVRTLAGGKWASTTITENKIKLVLVAFANQADFAAVQAHFGAPASSPSMKGALGGFSATFP